MHDIRAIRETPERFERAWSRRPGLDGKAIVAEILAVDADVRAAIQKKEAAEQARNAKSKEIGKAKAAKDEALAAKLMAEVAEAKSAIESAGKSESEATAKRDDMLARLPNLPMDDVPDGKDEHDNREVRKWGTPRNFNFKPKDHADLGEALKMMDFEAAARMSGARFVVLKGQLARLERALTAFMLDVQTREHGYTEHQVPLLVKPHAMFGTGQLPKFEDDLFQTRAPVNTELRANLASGPQALERYEAAQAAFGKLGAEYDEQMKQVNALSATSPVIAAQIGAGMEDNLAALVNDRAAAEAAVLDVARMYAGLVDYMAPERFLIPTAEVSLTNIVRESILDADQLPMRMTAATPCFRSEAGSAGRDTKGMIRMHQFIKVELVSITRPEDSDAELERMTNCAEEILRRLELPHRTVMLCAGDMGFGARKTYDIEVWLPSQDMYREISSCSTCGDFQARRMDARFRPEKGAKPEFVHTLNGSGLAVGRTLVAILENYQEEDGKVRVPRALAPYMGGLEVIG